MPRRDDPRAEDAAREELARRNRLRDRGRHPREYGSRGMDPFEYGRGGLFGAGYGWPFMPMVYPDLGYGPYAPPGDRMESRRERDFMDRASDEIASWFGDDAAEARREADHRGRGPKGYVRSDTRIEEDVNDRLTDDPDVDATEISVTVKDREVTLDGTVDSRLAKRHAEDCADSVSGVVHVQNNLRVQLPPDQTQVRS